MKKILLVGVSLILIGCSLAPQYERPMMPIPEHFKETGEWVKFTPPLCKAKPLPWWENFHDPILTRLEEQLIVANQDLKVAFAHYQEAIALAQLARSYFFPTAQALFNADRQQNSTTVSNSPNPSLFNQFLLGGVLNYEIDAWGAVRNQYITQSKRAKASAADIAAIQLSLQAELASNYFSLRGSDDQQRILDQTVVAYQKALFITQQRFKGGASPIGDVDEAVTQLNNAKTMAADMHLKRAQLEHAIAVLIGEIPSNFSLAPGRLSKDIFQISPNIPSTLLEERPDIAAAELRVEAANAYIGVARAAFFPTFNLTSTVGFQSQSLANLISKPSLFWSLGPLTLLSLTQPVAEITVFDGGRLLSLLKQAKAGYFETVALYRQTVLRAFQEVENELIAINQLDKERVTQERALKAAMSAWKQEQYRYEGGLVTFLQVVVVENIALQNELATVLIRTRQNIARVQLIKALGGEVYNVKNF